MTTEDAKSIGNKYFSQKNFQLAIENYTKAITLSTPLTPAESLAIYYNNRASSYYQLNHFEKCIEDAEKSISLNKSYLKAYFRLASAYFETQRMKKAKETIFKGFENCKDGKNDVEMSKLLSKIEEKLEYEKNEQKNIIKFQEEVQSQTANSDVLKMFQGIMKESMGLEDLKIAEFHLEYKRKFPQEKDHFQKLEQLFWEVKSQSMAIMSILTEKIDQEMRQTPMYLQKRFGCPLRADALQKIYQMDPGSIIPQVEAFKSERSSYSNKKFFQSFNNSSQLRTALNNGKNYVSIGFTDLHLEP